MKISNEGELIEEMINSYFVSIDCSYRCDTAAQAIAIKEAIEEKKNSFTVGISDEEWEDCVYTLFLLMAENGYDPHKQSEIIEFVKDYFPDLPYNDNED